MSGFERCWGGCFGSQLVLLPRSERGDNPIWVVHFFNCLARDHHLRELPSSRRFVFFSYEPVFSHVQTLAGMVQKPVLQPGKVHSLRFKQFSHVFRVWLCQYQPAFKPEASGESLEGWTTGVRLEDFQPWWNVHNVTSSWDRIPFFLQIHGIWRDPFFSIGSGMLNAGVHPKPATTVALDQGLWWLFFIEPSRLNLFNLGGIALKVKVQVGILYWRCDVSLPTIILGGHSKESHTSLVGN